MLKAVLFDLDGVLLDSFESNFRYFREVFVKSGYRPLGRAEFRPAFHLTLNEIIEKYLSKGDRREFRRIYSIAYKLYMIPEVPKTQVGSITTLKKLAKKYKLGIVTGRLKEGVDEYFDNFPVRRFFCVVVHSGHYKNPKPHPEPILKALRQLRIKPVEAVYVGDALTDIKAAREAGVISILFGEKKIGDPDYHLKHFKELGPLLEKLAKK